MAGFTDTVFRQLCKKEGADVLCSEFVMSNAVVSDSPDVWETLDFSEDQRPMGIQIFGSSAQSMVQAACMIEERIQPDFIDLNFGCPSDRITCMQAGASLLKSPKRLEDIARAVVQAVGHVPVTAKIRTGWDTHSIVAEEVALRLEGVGIRALTIHGRTRQQAYAGDADWDCIARVAEKTTLPIIGNGSIASADQVQHIRKNTAVRGVMIGRAALGYPWIFREIKQMLASGNPPEPPSLAERWQTLLKYSHTLASRPMRKKEENQINWMRSKLVKLTKNMPGSRPLRLRLHKVRQVEELPGIADWHLEQYSGVDEKLRRRLALRRAAIVRTEKTLPT